MITHRDLKLMNEAMVKYLESKEINNRRNVIIQDILDDEACFFKMNKSDALTILADIGVRTKQIRNYL